MALLSVDSVSKTYRTDSGRIAAVVLRDASFNVSAGAFISILGDPLSGKTTLLKIAAGIEAPDSGTVQLDGRGVPTSDDIDPRIALVTETPLPRELANLTVRDLLAIPLKLNGTESRRAVDAAYVVLARFEISELAGRRWGGLSSVQRRVVSIAQAIAREPAVLLLDEPLVGLRISQCERLVAQIRASVERRIAVVMTVGDLQAASRSDLVLTLSGGTLLHPAVGAPGRLVELARRPRG